LQIEAECIDEQTIDLRFEDRSVYTVALSVNEAEAFLEQLRQAIREARPEKAR
jgi:pyruvate-formate lyase-activating enzyme